MNLAGFDLNLLTAFDALMMERHVGRAARRLGIGQPSLSKRLATMRLLQRDDLFVRTRIGVRPTERAVELAEPVQASLATLEAALGGHRAFRPDRAERTFRVSMTDHIAAVLPPTLTTEIARIPSRVMLAVRFENRLSVADALADGEFNLAMTILPDAPPPIRSADLFEETFTYLVAKNHPEIRTELTSELYLKYPHVLVTTAGDTSRFADRLLAQEGQRRHVALSLPYNLAVPAIIVGGTMITTIASRVADRLAGDELARFKATVPFEPYRETMLWHRCNDGDPGLAWLRRTIGAIAANV